MMGTTSTEEDRVVVGVVEEEVDGVTMIMTTEAKISILRLEAIAPVVEEAVEEEEAEGTMVIGNRITGVVVEDIMVTMTVGTINLAAAVVGVVQMKGTTTSMPEIDTIIEMRVGLKLVERTQNGCSFAL